MNGSEDFKSGQEQGMILGELKSLNDKVELLGKSFEDFKNRTGNEVKSNSENISRLDERVAVLTRLSWIFATAGLGAIFVQILKMAAKSL